MEHFVTYGITLLTALGSSIGTFLLFRSKLRNANNQASKQQYHSFDEMSDTFSKKQAALILEVGELRKEVMNKDTYIHKLKTKIETMEATFNKRIKALEEAQKPI